MAGAAGGGTPLAELSKRAYKAQAIWFANGLWSVCKNDIDKIYAWCQAFADLDMQGPAKKGADGNELDQFWSAKFLEDNVKALTAMERKAALKVIDHDSNGKMSMIEFLTWHYKQDVGTVERAPQGSNQEALARAQAEVDLVSKQLAVVSTKLEATRAAEAELEAAIADLKKQEEEYANKIATLEAQANDPRASTVKKSRSANELAQLKAEDPLPLRRAKITQEAAQRRVQKERKALEEAYDELEAKMQAARAELDRVKAAGDGGGFGALWWMEREMFDADARLPTKRQKYDHSKPFSFDPAAK